MSSFKKRSTTTSAAALMPGVRPSSFSSPVPLVSTGVPALDDILSGGGLPSGSILAILPATGTASQSAAQIGASSSTPSSSAETDHITRSAAEPYIDLLLGYSVAQGVAANHHGVLLGQDVDSFAHGLMARADDLHDKELARLNNTTASRDSNESQEQERSGPSDQLDTVADDEEDAGSSTSSKDGETSAQREKEMKIAWRYERMKQFSTTVNTPSGAATKDEEPFCHTFDLSRRIHPLLVQKAKDDGILNLVELDFSATPTNSYQQAFREVQAAAKRCLEQVRAAKPGTPAPVLRISIRALGSPSWTVDRGQSIEVELIRFLGRLKRLLRSLALPDATDSVTPIPAIPAITVITISSSLLSTSFNGSNLPHRLVHVVDSAISLSAFSPSPSLRSAFSAYTGALKVLKTPCIGTLTNPSIRASVLRGMGAGAAGVGRDSTGAGSGTGTVGEGGAGGGENNLAFKVRRKRLVIETLHLDVEGGVSERRTKPPKNMDTENTPKQHHVPAAGQHTPSAPTPGSTPKDSASTQSPQSSQGTSQRSSFQRRQPTSSAATNEQSPSQTSSKPKFGGLSSLRQRGLAAAAAQGQTPTPTPNLEVELDTRQHHEVHQHNPNATTKPQPPSSRFTSSRAQDYDF